MGLPGPAAERGRLPNIAKYDVTEEIGHGGMATVYRAHDPRLSRDVAIKVIHRHLRDSEEIAHRFFTEAKAVAKLRHPNIVEVYDVSSPEEDEQYLVVELLRGRTLRKMLQASGPVPPEIGAAIVIELLAALSHAHGSGVIHRDIKPENVMIEHVPKDEAPDAAAGERVKIKLTDFGIAKLLDAQGVTSTGQVLGSPAHMAPEQIEGGEVDGRADVFGAGVLLYECLVGHLPFEGNNPAQVLRRVLEGSYPSAEREQPTVGKAWSALLDRALAHAPDDRFKDPSEMRERLSDELKRLGIAVSARADIEAWMDDPDAYKARHDEALIAKLCELGAGARRRGDAVAAAADYNRALAYAPHDQALLRIVSTMHRAEARRRLARRLLPVVLTAVTAGFVAFFATRAIRALTASGKLETGEKPTPSAIASTPPSATASVASSVAVAASAPKPIPPLPRPTPSVASKEPIARQLTFHRPTPEFGVRAALDDEASVEVLDGTHLALDGREHTLLLSCVNDFCEPKKITIPAGDKADDITPRLAIKPALLSIEGDPNSTYTIEELPMVTVRPGVQVKVPLSTGNMPIHVVQHPSARKEAVKLTAGQEVKATFLTTP